MATLETIEAAFIAKVDAITGIASQSDHEPERLPSLPAVTMVFVEPHQEDNETGPRADVTYRWNIHLYVKLSNYKAAQIKLKELMPEVLRITRVDPALNATCEYATLNGDGQEPTFNNDESWARKTFVLEAHTVEA